MEFHIRFTGPALAEITLAEVEPFVPDLTHLCRDGYEAQWRSALTRAVKGRHLTALLQSAEFDPDGIGRLRLYPLIPSELVRGPGGIFVTERHFDASLDPGLTRDPETGRPLVVFAPEVPSALDALLDPDIDGISHWFVPNHAVLAFLETAP